MFASDDLFNALNISAITTLLDTYLTKPALYDAMVLPSEYTGQESINFYFDVPYDASLNYEVYSYTINCRSETYIGSKTIANTVIENINRKSYTDYYIICSVGVTIPPEDETDNYNTPITAIIKKR